MAGKQREEEQFRDMRSYIERSSETFVRVVCNSAAFAPADGKHLAIPETPPRRATRIGTNHVVDVGSKVIRAMGDAHPWRWKGMRTARDGMAQSPIGERATIPSHNKLWWGLSTLDKQSSARALRLC